MLIYFKLFLTAVFWGGTFIAGRTLAGHIAPFSAAFLRYVMASAVLLFVVLQSRRRLPRLNGRQSVAIVLLGLTGIFSYNYCFFKGLQTVTASRASLIVANNPIFITLFSFLLLHEKMTARKVVGILLSVTGACIVIARGDVADLFREGLAVGDIYILGCVASWVTYTLVGKSLMTALSPLIAVTYSAVVGTVALGIPAVNEGVFRDLVHYSSSDWLNLIYLAVFGTVVGFFWYYEGVKQIGPSRAGQFINFVPVSALLMAFLILSEPVTVSLLVGAALVISGVYLTNAKSGRNMPLRGGENSFDSKDQKR